MMDEDAFRSPDSPDIVTEEGPTSSPSTSTTSQPIGPPVSEGINLGLKKAPIWKHFHVIDQGKKAECNYCKAKISVKASSTTSLHRHLTAKHKKESAVFVVEQNIKTETEKAQKLKKPQGLKQQTLSQSFEHHTTWPNEHPKAKKLTNKVGMWMAKNLHPYSLVEEEGLIEVLKEANPKYVLPSRNTFSRRIIPDLYESTKNKMKSEIEIDLPSVESLSFTTDLWTSRSNDPFISLTLHYMSQDFKLKRFCLANEYLPGEHDAQHIAQKINDITTDWNLNDTCIPIFAVTDNAATMVSAMKNLPWSHVSCFAHTLQLALKDAKKLTAGLSNMLATARSIVGHYKRSASAQQRLHTYQKNLGKKQVELIQDCETRWNSEYQMLSRLVQQKEAISGELVSSQTNINNLTSMEWKMAEEYIDILSPLDEATTKSSASRSPTISLIYPLISTIENLLEKRLRDKKPGAMFCRSLLNSIKSRFVKVKNEPLYKLSMALDPHFKCALLLPHEKAFILESLASEAVQIQKKRNNLPKPPTSSKPQKSNQDEPSNSKSGDFWTTFESLAETTELQTPEDPATLSEKSLCASQLEVYLSEPRIPPSESSLEWWNSNAIKFHYLAPLARKYLSIPATEVDSERVFSSAGNVVTMRRENLTTDHVKELVFLHENLKSS